MNIENLEKLYGKEEWDKIVTFDVKPGKKFYVKMNPIKGNTYIVLGDNDEQFFWNLNDARLYYNSI